MTDTPIKDRMEGLLRAHFSVAELQVKDDSHKHAGHAGSHNAGETHFRVTLVSADFSGQSRVARQRAVNSVLKPLFDERVHALQLFTHTPEEAALLMARKA